MTPLPVQCQNPKCRAIFPSGIEVTNSFNNTFDITAQCPKCGSKASVRGVFTFRDNVIEIVSASETTKDMIRNFLRVLEQAAAGDISSDQALKQAQTINPQYATLLENAFRFGLPTLLLLISMFQAYLQYEGNKSSTEDLKKILDAVTAQTAVLQENEAEYPVQNRSAHQVEPKTVSRSAPVKNQWTRRVEVNKERRRLRKAKREQFGGSRTH